MIYYVDIDNTICETKDGDYANSKPFTDRIEHINGLFDSGHEIHYWTARGNSSGVEWSDYTKEQLESWGCKFTSVNTGKPSYDLFIDDKAMNSMRYFRGVVR
jgi:hypothetical protein